MFSQLYVPLQVLTFPAPSLAHRYNVVPPEGAFKVAPFEVTVPPLVESQLLFSKLLPHLYLTWANPLPPVSLALTVAVRWLLNQVEDELDAETVGKVLSI